MLSKYTLPVARIGSALALVGGIGFVTSFALWRDQYRSCCPDERYSKNSLEAWVTHDEIRDAIDETWIAPVHASMYTAAGGLVALLGAGVYVATMRERSKNKKNP